MANQRTLVLYEPQDVHDLGPQRFDIHLFTEVEDDESHSIRATLPVLSDFGLTHQIITHPLHDLDPEQLLPGMIEVETVERSRISVLCLGGKATFETQPDNSTCKVQSGAPFVVMDKSIFDSDLGPTDLFTSELQAWLSIQRARAHGDMVTFYQLLTKVPPLTLYAKGLHLVVQRLEAIPADERNERYWRASHVINDAISVASKRSNWPDPLPNLERLLTLKSGA